MVLAPIVALGSALRWSRWPRFALGTGTVAFFVTPLALAGRALPRRSRGIDSVRQQVDSLPHGAETSRKPVTRHWEDHMRKRVVAVLVAGMFALPTAGASSAVAVRSTDPTSSTVAVPSFGNCRQLHNRWQYGVAKTSMMRFSAGGRGMAGSPVRSAALVSQSSISARNSSGVWT
jgi:hypothetical protein